MAYPSQQRISPSSLTNDIVRVVGTNINIAYYFFSFIGGVDVITIDLGTLESYDSSENRFHTEVGGIVRFEHSLKALYDWEARWKKPFLKGDVTDEEMVDYYKRMALDPFDVKFIDGFVAKALSDYITDSNTATTFSTFEDGQNGNNNQNRGKIYTAEELYVLMFQAQIFLEWENRNLNRLLTVLRIISTHNNPPKKMSNNEIFRQNANINEQRKAMMKSKG